MQEVEKRKVLSARMAAEEEAAVVDQLSCFAWAREVCECRAVLDVDVNRGHVPAPKHPFFSPRGPRFHYP